MAQTKLRERDRRTHLFPIRYSPAEFAELKRRARSSPYQTITAYIRGQTVGEVAAVTNAAVTANGKSGK